MFSFLHLVELGSVMEFLELIVPFTYFGSFEYVAVLLEQFEVR
jgi:hypothetical protein